ncbi:MAG: hypothetical protein V4454_12895 [Pseudomonadota bacterium]
MRKILLTGLMLVAAGVHAQEVLLTPSFTVTIVGCAEGNVACDDVKYTGVSRKTGATLRLTGKTLHTMGADGVTPGRFLGYRFRNGATLYTVTEGGVLEVRQGAKTLFSEQGEWRGR